MPPYMRAIRILEQTMHEERVGALKALLGMTEHAAASSDVVLGLFHQVAFDNGRATAMQGLPVTDNPYSEGAEGNARRCWNAGYQSFSKNF